MRRTAVIYAVTYASTVMIENAMDTTINDNWCIAYAICPYHIPERWVVTILSDARASRKVKHNATKYRRSYIREGSSVVLTQQSTLFHMILNMNHELHYWAVGLIVQLPAPRK